MAVDLGEGDIVMVRLEYSDESDLADTAFNVLYYQVLSTSVSSTGLPTAIDIPFAPFGVAAGEVFYNAWVNAWKVFASEDVVMTGCSVQKIRGEPRSTLFHYTPEAATTGMILGDSLPMQDAVTLLKQTGYGERWGQGRMFVPGIPELHAEGGRITPAGMTNLADMVTLISNVFLITDGTYDTQLAPVLWAPTNTTVIPPVPERVTRITMGSLSDDVVKTQRRRRPGKGS